MDNLENQGGTANRSLLERLGLTGNDQNTHPANTFDELTSQEIIDNMADALAVAGDILAVDANMIQVNQTARDVNFMPLQFKKLLELTPAYKTQLNPPVLAFDDAGINPDSKTMYKLAFAAGSMPADITLGLAIRVQTRNTNRGLTQLTVTMPSGLSAMFKLRDINRDGWIVILGNMLDQNSAIDSLSSVGPLSTDIVVTGTKTPVTEQYLFSPDQLLLTETEISGINANIDVYPITYTRQTAAIVAGAYYGDRIPELASVLLDAYSGKN